MRRGGGGGANKGLKFLIFKFKDLQQRWGGTVLNYAKGKGFEMYPWVW